MGYGRIPGPSAYRPAQQALQPALMGPNAGVQHTLSLSNCPPTAPNHMYVSPELSRYVRAGQPRTAQDNPQEASMLATVLPTLPAYEAAAH